jgi:hypothetical protein
MDSRRFQRKKKNLPAKGREKNEKKKNKDDMLFIFRVLSRPFAGKFF